MMIEKNSLMFLFRLMHSSHKRKIPFIPSFLMRFIRVVYACELPPQTQIGRGSLFVHNGLGVVVHPKAIIGKNVKIYQNVSIAGRNNRGTPIIGNNVFIGAGACILGGVKIGDNAMIGANSVVIDDVPRNSVIVGVPGKVVKINS
jgi:serine O-acetyltransferase